jgi:hypothetical protein
VVQIAPRLTIGIPTQGRRPELLLKAVASAVAQSVPCRVLIADQGEGDTVAKAIGPYLAHPLLRVVSTKEHASCLWENWRLCAEHCDTELFAWFQDDDILAGHFAFRAITGLDQFPQAQTWIARLGLSYDGTLALPGGGPGPMVPMDLLTGARTVVHGRLMVAAGFFTAFALSPGVAFRVNPQTMRAVGNCPTDSDLFNERIILAELGMLGEVVCDPAIVGYWRHHGENESRRQNEAGEAGEQGKRMVRHISRLLSESLEWQTALGGWGLVMGREACARMWKEAGEYAGVTPELDEAREVLKDVAGIVDAAPEERTRTPVERAINRRANRAERRAHTHG